MVAIYNVEDGYGQNPKTLGDWVKNFRLKKMQMKRKIRSGGGLRVCAILSTALMSAELELRRKQQERFQKWLEFQTKINKNHELQSSSELRHQRITPATEDDVEDGRNMVLIENRQNHYDQKSCKQSEEINKLWKCELSELDNFMRSISSSCNNDDNNKNNCDSDTIGSFRKIDNYNENFAHTQSIEVTS